MIELLRRDSVTRTFRGRRPHRRPGTREVPDLVRLAPVAGAAPSPHPPVRIFVGTEFGSRHQQYEKFYGGASFIVKQNVYRNFDFKRACALVDAALALPPLEAD